MLPRRTTPAKPHLACGPATVAHRATRPASQAEPHAHCIADRPARGVAARRHRQQLCREIEAQAEKCGYSSQHLDKHLRAGRILRVGRGVYRLEQFPDGEYEDLVALWLGRAARECSRMRRASSSMTLGCPAIQDTHDGADRLAHATPAGSGGTHPPLRRPDEVRSDLGRCGPRHHRPESNRRVHQRARRPRSHQAGHSSSEGTRPRER